MLLIGLSLLSYNFDCIKRGGCYINQALTDDVCHLLINQEMYLEDRDKKNMRQKPLIPQSPIEMSIQEMIDCIVRAGYVVTKSDSIRGFG